MRLIAIATAAFLAAGSAFGFDPVSLEIVGLHLGTQETEVVSRLKSQGYTLSQTSEAITAKTLDGALLITLSADRTVTEIRYTFAARGVGGPAKVREAVLTHFGNPDQANPPAWCRTLGRDGICPPDQAMLTFYPDSLTLLLHGDTDAKK